MTTAEKNAVLGYLEFLLTSMVEGLEADKTINGQSQVGPVYDAAYEVLNEMERTFADLKEYEKSNRY